MKLGCSSWSYDAAFRAGRMDVFEFLRLCAEELDVDGVELARSRGTGARLSNARAAGCRELIDVRH